MRLYFDTNIFDFIAKAKEARAVRKFLDAAKHRVVASSANLQELWAISKPGLQRTQLLTLVTVADAYEEKPQSWLHAREVRGEIERLRKDWLRPVIFNKHERLFLKLHQANWKDAKRVTLVSARTVEKYRHDFEIGVRRSRTFQKRAREERLTQKTRLDLGTGRKDRIRLLNIDFRDPEIYWRAECLQVWYNAIALQCAASRDYADWLCPYVREDAFSEATYIDFWMKEVNADRVPRNRLVGLVSFYQAEHKIGHGNGLDQTHASSIFDAHAFLTADRAFWKVLTEVVEKHFPTLPPPIFVDRSAPSALEQLKSTLALLG